MARMKGQHINFCVHICGLVINVDLVLAECCGKGLIEIKCPFKYKELISSYM